MSNERVAVTGCIGFLGCWVLGAILLSTFRAKKGTLCVPPRLGGKYGVKQYNRSGAEIRAEIGTGAV